MNKKGFTLIELLAVIVILAVIALIVTPIVTGIIAQAKESANARSVEGHIKNVEYAIILNAFSSASGMEAFDNVTSGATIEAEFALPTNDTITCTSYTILHGAVQSASGCKDKDDKWGKSYNYSNINGAVVSDSSNESEHIVETWDKYYYFSNWNFINNTTLGDKDIPYFIRENLTSGKKQLCYDNDTLFCAEYGRWDCEIELQNNQAICTNSSYITSLFGANPHIEESYEDEFGTVYCTGNEQISYCSDGSVYGMTINRRSMSIWKDEYGNAVIDYNIDSL